MIENVECLEPELKHVAFLVRHTEFLVYFGIESDNSRTPDCIAPDIPKLSGRSFGEGRQAPIPGCGGAVEIRAHTGCIRAIVSARTGAGVVDPADRQISGHTALQGQSAAQLPAADDRVGHRIGYV